MPLLAPNDEGPFGPEDARWLEWHARSLGGHEAAPLPRYDAPIGSRESFNVERLFDCPEDRLRGMHVTACRHAASTGNVTDALIHATFIRMLDRIIDYETRKAAKK